MRSLIVTADDAGLHRGMTDGAIRAHRDGIVTACSVVASGEAFDDAVVKLREVPSLEVGVHLTLVGERPLTAASLPKSYVGFVARYPWTPDRVLERELRAQVERVLATRLRVTHLNGHQHLHVLPRVFAIATRLAREFSIPWIRIPADVRLSGSLARRVSIGALRALARRAGEGRTIGVSEAGHLDAQAIVRLLVHLPEGVTELVTHPGVGDRELAQRYRWNYAWERETEALCDPAVRGAIESAGIRLVRPSEAL